MEGPEDSCHLRTVLSRDGVGVPVRDSIQLPQALHGQVHPVVVVHYAGHSTARIVPCMMDNYAKDVSGRPIGAHGTVQAHPRLKRREGWHQVDRREGQSWISHADLSRTAGCSVPVLWGLIQVHRLDSKQRESARGEERRCRQRVRPRAVHQPGSKEVQGGMGVGGDWVRHTADTLWPREHGVHDPPHTSTVHPIGVQVTTVLGGGAKAHEARGACCRCQGREDSGEGEAGVMEEGGHWPAPSPRPNCWCHAVHGRSMDCRVSVQRGGVQIAPEVPLTPNGQDGRGEMSAGHVVQVMRLHWNTSAHTVGTGWGRLGP